MECELCGKSVFSFQQVEEQNVCPTCYDTVIAKQKAEGRYVIPEPKIQPAPLAPVPTITKFLRFFCGIIVARIFGGIPWPTMIHGAPVIIAFLSGSTIVVGYYFGWKAGDFIGNKISTRRSEK